MVPTTRSGRLWLAFGALALALSVSLPVAAQRIDTVFSNILVRGIATAGVRLVSRITHRDAGSTQAVTAAGTIATTPGRGYYKVVGSPGAVTTGTTTAVTAGTVIGEEIILQGTSDTNTVTVATNGTSNVKSLTATTTRLLGNEDLLSLVWDGTNWLERSFNNNL